MKTLYRKFFQMETRNLLLAVLLPVLILGLMTGFLSVRILRQEIDNSFETRARYFSHHLSNITQTVEDLYNSLSRNSIITPNLKDAILQASRGELTEKEQEQFHGLLELIFASCQKNPYVDSCYIYYDDTDYYISSPQQLISLEESPDTGWYETYLLSGPDTRAWTETRTMIRADGTIGKVLTVYSRIFPATDPDRPCGILILNIDSTPLKNLLENWNRQSKTIALITAESGRILFSPPSIDQTLSVPLSELGPTLRTQFDSVWRQDTQERRNISVGSVSCVCLVQRLSRFGWHLVLITPKGNLYAPVNRLLFLLISMILLTLLCGVLFAAYTANQKVRDIARIHDSIQRAKEGTLPKCGSLLARVQEKSAPETDRTDAQKKPDTGVSDYSKALRELIDSFLDKDYLSVQLAERQHYAQVLELKALQSQLNPHFLFNTLTTIQWKAIALTGGQNHASDMIEYLSDILRYSLDDSSRMATIREEQAMLESYAAIQHIRYGERFHYSCSCDPAISGHYVIRMLLQPLVENSIHHGMNKNSGCLNVQISITGEGDKVRICVSDDGSGMDENRLQEIRAGLTESMSEGGRHIGLYNVSKRIMLTYGEDVHPNICSTPGQGTVITLLLPLLDADPFLRSSKEA